MQNAFVKKSIVAVMIFIGFMALDVEKVQAGLSDADKSKKSPELIVAERGLKIWGYRPVESYKYPDQFCDPGVGKKRKSFIRESNPCRKCRGCRIPTTGLH